MTTTINPTTQHTTRLTTHLTHITRHDNDLERDRTELVRANKVLIGDLTTPTNGLIAAHRINLNTGIVEPAWFTVRADALAWIGEAAPH